MRIFRDYARLMLFAAGMLIGVQVPNFIDQYAKRISAHHLEAKANFAGYQDTAAKHFGADVEALLKHYESSEDAVFRDDARHLRQIHARVLMFAAELKALDAALWKRIWHVAFFADPAVRDETLAEYTYTVPLNPEAIGCGLALGLASALVFEIVFFGLIGLSIRPIRRAKPRAS
jgi:Protein of unknown function (DUF2937)